MDMKMDCCVLNVIYIYIVINLDYMRSLLITRLPFLACVGVFVFYLWWSYYTRK